MDERWSRRGVVAALFAAFVAAFLSPGAFAQDADAASKAFEAGPIRVFLPFGAGSGTDTYARMVVQQMTGLLPAPLVIYNKPGANGAIAAETVARAKPDGTTFLFTTNTTHAGNPYLIKNLSYDPVKDFEPVSKLGNLTFFVVVPADSPYGDLASMVAAARKAPKTVTYGASNSFGIVSGSKLGKVAGVQFTEVPYKSSPEIMNDLLGGQINFAFADLGAAAALVKGGKLRALAVLADQRFPALPDVPTMKEAGYLGFDVVAWFAMFAPAGTPKPVIARMGAALNAALANPELKQRTAAMGLDAFGSTPEELRAYVKAQLALWARLTADAGLKPE